MSSPWVHGRREDAGTFGVLGAAHAYEGVVVLSDVSFELREGQVHALVGQNGAGKSTLIKILTGALRPLQGEIRVGEQIVIFDSPAEAKRSGVGVVHQEVQLFPQLDVATNIYALCHTLPRRRLARAIDWRLIQERVRVQLEGLGISLEPHRLVADLTLAERRLVEIAKAMVQRPRFLILDEPTASLETRAAGRVLDLLDRLCAEGIGLCFISHRLDEVRRIADEVTVLRDGQVAGRLEAGASEADIVSLMFGEQQVRARERESIAREGALGEGAPRDAASKGPIGEEVVLSIRDLTLRGGRAPVELDLRKGEVVGLTGLLGSGAEQVVRMVGGAQPSGGTVTTKGRRVRISSPRAAIAAGIGFIPEDRKNAGLVPELSVAVNISLASLGALGRWGLVRNRRLLERAEGYRRQLSIKAPSLRAHVKTLSGGNQQKVVVAKCLAAKTRILSSEGPTNGVDVVAKTQIHHLLREFADEGGAVLVASNDTSELLEICDRIVVFRQGSVVAVLATKESGHQEVVLAGVRDPERLLDSLMSGEEQLVPA
jgi:ribose transport system ATP-binding protein